AGGGPGDVEPAVAGRAVGAAGDPGVGRVEQPLDGGLRAQPLSEEQRHGPGHVGGGHRRAGQVAVLVLLALLPVGRPHLVRFVAVGGAAGGDDGPLGVAGGAGVVGDEVVGPGGADDQGVEVAVVLAADPGAEEVGVPGGDD